MSRRHQIPKHETWNTFYLITWERTQSGNEIGPVYVILQNIKNILWKIWPGN